MIIPDKPIEDTKAQIDDNEDFIMPTPSPVRAKRSKVLAECVQVCFDAKETMSQESEFNDKVNFTLARIESTEKHYENYQNTFEKLYTRVLNPATQRSKST